MNELISVIINVYNREKLIRKCLDSVINQTYKNLEILIINDGSTDDTLKICQSYLDKRIRIITTENMGLSVSRNIGIENAKGQYIYFVDSDDFIEKDVIEYLYKLCKKYDVMISTCRPLDIYSYDFKLKKVKEKISVLTSQKMLRIMLLDIDTSTPAWNKLIKRELFNDIRFNENLVDDATAVTYKIILKANKIAYSNQFKYFYYNHPEGMSKKANSKLIKDEYKAIIQRYNDIKKIYPGFMANKICVLSYIAKAYFIGDEEMQRFLDEQKSIKLFNELFSLKILACRMKFREKIKILLFRINPRLFKNCVNLYLKFKKLIKKGKNMYRKYIKRFLDIIISFIALIVLSPILLVIGLIIKIKENSNIIYKQVRTGKYGKNFVIYKFRTIKDGKITKFGAFLRNSSLDELPQFYNVLKGDMSIVGPRPWIPDYFERFNEKQKRRNDVSPGLVGLAQINGRKELDIIAKIYYDIYYVENLTIVRDIKILIKSLKVIFKKEDINGGNDYIQKELDKLENFAKDKV